jgi:hypothetical protein
MKIIVNFLCFCFFALQLNAQIPEGKTAISALYIYTLETGKAELILKEKRHFEAPNWSHDGQFLLINASGILEKVSIKGEKLGLLPTGEITNANNDHGYSFDGKTLFISSSLPTIKEGSSFIFKVASEGGIPMRLTANTPSYWHGVSPDGKTIVYCAERNGNYDVYAMSSEGGAETRLTAADGLDDGPEYSPEGKYSYMNSFRTGKMQIWRMQPDGSKPEQVTFDNYSNWFAHISPNNKQATIISYLEDQGQKHPFGMQVKLRLVNLVDKTIKDLTEPFFGGQGTINVPSWSPDGKKFAFVKYELEDKK